MRGDEWQDQCRQIAQRLVSQLGSIREAARSIGVNHEGYRRLVNGGPVPRGPDRAAYLGLLNVPLFDTDGGTAPSVLRETSAPSYDGAARTFGSDAERISYALGVLDMASRSNRIVMETSNEVSRAISAASAALLAPLSGPAPTAPAKTDAEYIAMHDAASQQAAAAASATQGGKRRRATGR